MALRDGYVHLCVCSFVYRLKRVLVGHWPAWPRISSDRSTARPTGPRVFQTFPMPRERLSRCEIYAPGGGLLVESINAPHLFTSRDSCLKSAAAPRYCSSHKICDMYHLLSNYLAKDSVLAIKKLRTARARVNIPQLFRLRPSVLRS